MAVAAKGSAAASPPVPTTSIKVLIAFNLLSLFLYTIEWKRTGTVITTSGERSQGYHEIPAILAFTTMYNQ
eukprot:11906401-Ditylum_brightwellii.AAC.1